MIIYKPVSDIERIKELFDNSLIDEKCVFGGYIGFEEDGTNVGKCLVKIDGYNCYFIHIECDLSD